MICDVCEKVCEIRYVDFESKKWMCADCYEADEGVNEDE